MKIQVLGSGCPTCKKLYEATQQAAHEIGLPDEVEYITDVSKMVEMGVMSSPVLAINGEPVMTGRVPDVKELKEIITNGNKSGNSLSEKKSGCSCGGVC